VVVTWKEFKVGGYPACSTTPPQGPAGPSDFSTLNLRGSRLENAPRVDTSILKKRTRKLLYSRNSGWTELRSELVGCWIVFYWLWLFE